MATAKKETFEVPGGQVVVTNPDKIYFPEARFTKRDLVAYYLAVADGALRGVARRPMLLKRFPNGIKEEAFFQKRAPTTRPDFVETVTLHFPSGRSADHIVVRDVVQLGWVINLGCIDLNPHPVRVDDLDHPDELRVDLDPVPGVGWKQIVDVAFVAKEALEAVGLQGFAKTSGSRGIHIYARIARNWSFDEVRRSALALARDVEKRAPTIATSRWWKEERHGVFLDYNQNAKDRTVASAYSVRPTVDGRVSMPLAWNDLRDCEPGDFTLATVPAMFQARGDAHATIDDREGSLEKLLALSAAQNEGDAPWPPHYRKQEGEPARVAPSRAKGTSRRVSTMPLVVIGRAEKKDDALEGLARWKTRHPKAAAHLAVDDVLVDGMRGRFSVWYRIRVNLRHVPEEDRPPQEAFDPDFDPETMFK